jgi:hypothetical protein
MSSAARKALVALGCALVAGVALYFTFFRDTDEERIKKVLSRFAKVVSVKADDNVLSRTGRLRSELKTVVDDGVRVTVPELNVRSSGRKQLEDDAARAGLAFSEAECEFGSVAIKLDEGATFATVDAIAVVTGVRGGERKVDRRDVHFLVRKDGDWKITSIDVLPQPRE